MSDFRFPESIHGKGRLSYHDLVPVLQVHGTPREIGTQIGKLALGHARQLWNYPKDYLRSRLPSSLLAWLVGWLLKRHTRGLYQNIPPRFREEIEAIIQTGIPPDVLISGNTLFDLSGLSLGRLVFGCSSFYAQSERSASGSLLFGRNLDFFDVGYLHCYSLITIYPAQNGRRAFAALGFPGSVGCFSGMNDAGLCLARHEVQEPISKCTYDPQGIPFAIIYREVLECCTTVAEAVDFLRKTRPASVGNLILCDIHRGCVAEISPDGLLTVEPQDGMGFCTNHFSASAHANPRQTDDFQTLTRFQQLARCADPSRNDYRVEDIQQVLHSVHQGDMTIQTMIFEPAYRVVHVGFGTPPTTARRLTRLELAPLFRDSV